MGQPSNIWRRIPTQDFVLCTHKTHPNTKNTGSTREGGCVTVHMRTRPLRSALFLTSGRYTYYKGYPIVEPRWRSWTENALLNGRVRMWTVTYGSLCDVTLRCACDVPRYCVPVGFVSRSAVRQEFSSLVCVARLCRASADGVCKSSLLSS